MNTLDTGFQRKRHERCPYCGEFIELLVDLSEGSQSYVEDCEVCCRPIFIELFVSEEDNDREEITVEDDDMEELDSDSSLPFRVLLKKEND